ncbi:putative membrane protein [Exiguobacterium sp. S17]|nr:putative membrane protein [Exiguobacterium sp. S17]
MLIERDSAFLELIAYDHLLGPFMMLFAVAPVCSAIISEYTIRYFKKNDNSRLYTALLFIYIFTIIHTYFTLRSFLQQVNDMSL